MNTHYIKSLFLVPKRPNSEVLLAVLRLMQCFVIKQNIMRTLIEDEKNATPQTQCPCLY